MDELTVSINRVGNNINQIARVINTTKDVNNYALMQNWLKIFSEYNLVLNTVYSVIMKLYRDKEI